VLKVVIVEDDSLLRKELASLVASMEEIEVTGVFSGGEEFLAQVWRIKPDVLFLDIGLPGVSGIHIAEYIRKNFPYLDIVFITAYDECISDAFCLYASDFITKPINTERLVQTIGRIKGKLLTTDLKIELRCKDSVELLDQKTIFFVEALMKKCMIYTA